MSLIIRVTSADDNKVFTRKLDAENPRIALPGDARFAVVDEATGEVLQVRPKIVQNAQGQDELIFVFEHAGEVIELAVSEAAAWPADTAMAMNEGLAEGETVSDVGDAAEIERTGSRVNLFEGLEAGSTGWIIGGLLAAGIGIAIVADGDDGEDEPAIIPDTEAPAAPTAIDLSDDTDPDGDDRISSGTGAVITGTAEPGSTVEIFFGGDSQGTTTAGEDGSFSFTVDLPEGTSNVTFTATDEAGNTSVASAPLSVLVDSIAPAAPANLDLDAADDDGVADDDNRVSDGEDLTVSGTAEAGSTVELLSGDTVLATTTATAEGTFSADVTLPAGVTALTARATDAAGNTSVASAPLTITVVDAPAAPIGLALDPADNTGSPTDNLTDQTDDLTITGMAAAGATVELFLDGTSQGTTTAGMDGAFSFDVDVMSGTRTFTAVTVDEFGRSSEASGALTLEVGQPPQALNTTIDGDGDVVTVYFNEQIDPASAPVAGQFSIEDGDGDTLASVVDLQITGNRITLYLDNAVGADDGPLLSYTSAAGTVTDAAGNAASDLIDVPLTNDLSTTASNAISISRTERLDLDGAEIVAFDPGSDRFFVTSGDGLQVIGADSNLNLTLLGTISLGSNNITSVDVANGVVAVAVAADPAQEPGSIFLLDASSDAFDGTSVFDEIEVGALPDAVTFTPDGTKLLVANEGERTPLDDVTDDNPQVDPVGSISIITLNGGDPLDTSVQSAGFEAFNDQLEALVSAGLRTFAGTPGNEDLTLAQDLEPEYIAVSPDGTTATVTLQEANAVAIVDIASATVIDIQPLGLKPFEGLNFDVSDRDDAVNPGGFDLSNVFGQFMPDTISSYTGADGQTYYVIANEGDARDDFFDGPDGRVDDLDLDPTVFPNAADLQQDENLGRLEVTVQPGLDGDTDGDGDIDQILAYGGRSFAILDAAGHIVFDSGSQLEELAASLGEFIGDDFPDTGVFDDSRSDAKGPEPEAITTGVFGDNVLAFVGLERGGGGVAVYDVTDPANVSFVTYLRDANTLAPEGLIYIPEDESPSGRAVLAVASEGSDPIDEDVGQALTVFEIAPEGTYTLQLLHFADAEAKNLAIETAPNLAALVDAFEDDYANSITLSGGDNYIPGLFFDAQADQRIEDQFGFSGGPRIDIAIHNAIGVQASTVGNHEFDRGPGNFAFAITSEGAYEGALFPYLSANLDFSAEPTLAPLFEQTIGAGNEGLEFADELNGMIAPSAVIEEGGELIGLVGATTQVLDTLTSLGAVDPLGPNENNMQALAIFLQPYVDDLIAQGVNKIIVQSHLQDIGLEQALAPLLTGVDIILAAGSNTRLADETDELSTFGGARPAEAQGPYPIVTQGLDGGTTLIVNTDSEYTYLGRLVVDFDDEGNIVLDSLDEDINGAYAATDENVAEVYDVEESDNFTVTTQNGAISAAAASAAVTGNAYANFHSVENPNGEVRGQLMLVADNRDEDGNGPIVFDVELSGANEVPPVATDAFGSGRVIVLARDGEFTYNSEYTIYNFDSANLTGGHIHIGAPGENGPIEENILDDDGTMVEDFAFNFLDNAYAEATRGGEVKELVDAVDDIIATQLANVFGYSDVFLEGNRVPGVRTQETNLGNLTADANVAAARAALENEGEDATYVVAIKNGGGIRDSIGQDEVIGDTVTRVPNDGGVITEQDIGAVLAFNNGLVVFETTPQDLLDLLNSPNTFRFANGGYLQTSGLQVSYEYDLEEGEEVDGSTDFTVIDVALIDDAGNKVALVDDGVVVAGAPATINVVGLDFTASTDGDGYEFAENGDNFRYIVEDEDGVLALSDPLAEVQQTGQPAGDLIVDTGAFAGEFYGEQSALADYLIANFGTLENAFDMAETDQDEDERIQNVDEREDTVLEGTDVTIAAEAPAADFAVMLEESFA